MTGRPVCTCGSLDKLARDPHRPVYRDESGRCFLEVGPELRLEVRSCWHCGGYEKQGGRYFRGGDPCSCGAPQTWAADPALAVEYDVRMNEYTCDGSLFY